MSETYYPQPHETTEDVHFFANTGDDERIYLMEECAELIQACTKSIRKWSDDTRKNLVEEMAHVYMSLNHVRHQYKISAEEIQEKIDEKVMIYRVADMFKKERDFIREAHDVISKRF